ncbi:Toll-like receptor 4 [Mytilus coruscus]|uniref:Toll-like receptor 4 n=1 Tax=Mytilus coruscus TaxID=42192 RepID=A0A6J8CWJ8_MYTCO|nr:Toll-like receptor 4 [Mytilus coruscus]
MFENQELFHNKDSYKCKSDNGTIIVLSRLKNIVSILQKSCASYTVLTIGISVAVVAVILILVGGLLYRYRWRLRYAYYMTRSKYKRDRQVNTEMTYAYNAFISYSDEEKDFVVNECIPNLEEFENLRLCIHQRDFIPGEEITHNITNGIHNSNKTICIITRAFLDSYYCMFEFNMARMESIYSREGHNILFLVFYEQILPRELPLIMLELVQQQSYIEYPDDLQGNVVFLEKNKRSNRITITTL